MKTSISQQEMEALLPDYAFGKLSGDDKQQFEANLPDFPELQRELDQVRAVFDSFDKAEFLEKTTRRTRNLSVDVQQKRAHLFQKESARRRYVRQLLPALGMVLVSVGFYYFSAIRNPAIPEKTISYGEQHSFFYRHDLMPLTGGDKSEEKFAEISVAVSEQNPLNSSLAHFTIEDISTADELQTLSKTTLKQLSKEMMYSFSDSAISDDLVSELSETEFQKLIEEIENDDTI